MNKRDMAMAGCALMLALPAAAMAADSLEVFPYALSGGVPNLDLRARWEEVEQANALDPATAYTLRARLGYTTGKWNDLDVVTEFEGTFPYGAEAYNNGPGSSFKPTRSVIADPKGTELNQFMLRYAGLPGTTLKLGRQRLILDNARFIGNVGWRQNEQTFDAFTAVNTLLPKTTLTLSYLSRVNTVTYTGYQINGYLLNAAYAWGPQFNLSGYGYLLDFAPEAVKAPQRVDSQTYGLRASGAVPMESFKLLYAAEYAHQNHYKDAPGTVSAPYYLGELGAAAFGVSAKLGYEVLGGDGVYGFQTPLATLHVFQGWADVFLGKTPNTGVRDAYLRVEGGVAGINLLGFYHDYRGDSDRGKFGAEYNLQASKAINDSTMLTVKYADYHAGTLKADIGAASVDTRKTWVQLEYKF